MPADPVSVRQDVVLVIDRTIGIYLSVYYGTQRNVHTIYLYYLFGYIEDFFLLLFCFGFGGKTIYGHNI